MAGARTIAYFSMEVALEPQMPTYAGGLGVLAGDTIRAAADLGVRMVAVTLLHRRGFLQQRLDASGWQTESPVQWQVAEFLEEMPQRARVTIEGRTIGIRAWRRKVRGVGGHAVSVYFLDTDLPENAPADRELTHHLYGGDQRYRLAQETLLGIGGVRALRALGYDRGDVARYHMNEGHAALLGLELLREEAIAGDRDAITWQDVEAVRSVCVFTTHTPVPAGHDQFPMDLVRQVLGPQSFAADVDWRSIVCAENRFNMTLMALSLSRYVNGVAKRHAEVTRLMFAQYAIDAITNGVHAGTWVSPPFAELFDCYIPDWRQDTFALRYALSIPRDPFRDAHLRAKRNLLSYVREQGTQMSEDVLTIGCARRATAYKRADLILQDPQRLGSIGEKLGRLQVIFAGKAHPGDTEGKRIIQKIVAMGRQLGGPVRVAFLEDYGMRLGGLMTAGVDVWLNTPMPPMEASGTSGMKAALNGVPSLSVLDGWWIEGCIEGVTGWSIGTDHGGRPSDHTDDASLLYDKLERCVLPTYYQSPERFLDIMVHAIALNGSFFNTHRMLQQYVTKAYFA